MTTCGTCKYYLPKTQVCCRKGVTDRYCLEGWYRGCNGKFWEGGVKEVIDKIMWHLYCAEIINREQKNQLLKELRRAEA